MELGSFGRATGALYHQVISPAPGLLDFALKPLICAKILFVCKIFLGSTVFLKWIDSCISTIHELIKLSH